MHCVAPVCRKAMHLCSPCVQESDTLCCPCVQEDSAVQCASQGKAGRHMISILLVGEMVRVDTPSPTPRN
jgi:hypothetical protein